MISLIDIFGLLVLATMVAISLIISFYIFVEYAHTDEAKVPKVNYVKVLTIWGMGLSIFLVIAPLFDIYFSYKPFAN